MGIFNKRPLALFSIIFLISALFAYFLPNDLKIIIGVAVLACIGLILIFAKIAKRKMIKVVTVAVCISAIVFSFLHSLIFVGIPKQRAEKYVGENTVLCYVIDEGEFSGYTREYSVKISQIGDEAVNIKALLVCGFDVAVSAGDEIYGYARIDQRKAHEPEQLLTVYMDDIEKCYLRYTSSGKGIIDFLFSDCGLEILSGKLSDLIKTRLFYLLGEEKGALAIGFFTGDRSDITTEVTRDFRRAGVSHLMAVSGSHIAILLGGIEIILRKLYIHKNIRCIVITVFSVLFLFITGFSLSACRSVFMLYAVYIGYFTYEENDPLTSLFVSVAVIVLIFPFSVVDLGLWMSFLATLGLLTLYPVIEDKIPYPRKIKKPWRWLLLIGREILLIALMTFIANMFLLPVIWYFFGEISLVSVLSNVLITSISSVFLLLIPLLLIFSKIPFIGMTLSWIVSSLADIIIFIVGVCSRLPNATVSLKYDFCTYIIIPFTISMMILLVIRLKRKIFTFLPIVCSAIVFTVCFAVYSIWIAKPEIEYINNNDNDLLVVMENNCISVCDNTSGGLIGYYDTLDALERSVGTEIDKYVLTHYHRGHAITLDMVCKKAIVRTIYMPYPITESDFEYAEGIWNEAVEKGIDVVIYDNDENIDLTPHVRMRSFMTKDHTDGPFICIWSNRNSIVYSSPGRIDKTANYDTLILSGHGISGDEKYDIAGENANEIYISSRRLLKQMTFVSNKNIFAPRISDGSYRMRFVFD